ncbi:uncharacterized protein LOC106660111 [Trichogramma pretiosum]|uniref:uncharacterized protein LOC106660111 n=1 Tax=Trichogramma pretiosum TaxID=7493 RepID=UPI0006C9C44F|nr:uncharacterized protein LOC106660111 [Trichogramma pretiosum]
MESKEDIVRVRKELNDTWTNAPDDNIFYVMNSSKAKNFETFPYYELPTNLKYEVMALQEKLDEIIFIDFECKYVPIIKIEKRIQTSYTNEKSLIILIEKGFDYDNKCRFQEKSQLKSDEHKEVKILKKKVSDQIIL